MKRRETNTNGKRIKCLKSSDCENSSPNIHEEGELGIIESVTVQNFMCHDNFTLNFGPHMNFIIGQNGSGKSAILTAIMLALGGKSSSTNRFTNLKGFIKSGKNKSKIEVVLRNKGNLAFKPELYGEKITVIREFNKEGVGCYRIKSASGTECSNRKSDLINVVEAMDIMVECPVCVLTQATSKRFLISKNASEERLFEFFYKGTGLEMLEDKYKQMTILRQEGEAELEKKKQAIPEIKKELKKWKRFLDASKRITDYKNEAIWAGVIEMEKQVQEKEKAFETLYEELQEHKEDMERCKKSFAEKTSELDELTAQKNNSDSEMEKCRKTLEELKTKYEGFASSFRKKKGSLQRLESEKIKFEEDVLDLEKCINEQKMKDQENLEELKNKRKEQAKKIKDENLDLEKKLKSCEERIQTKRTEQSNIKNYKETLRAEINRHSYECKKIQDNLHSIKNAIKNKVNAFGEKTEKVLWEIENERRFIKPPVGPIGIYLDIKDYRWAAAVEFAINSSLLNSFCVDNHKDSKLLREILRKHYQNLPSIIVSPYESQMFDVQQGRVQSRFPSVLDMLKIKDHRVANCLIDQAQIEKKILVENEEERPNLMKKPPLNCHSAYFMNCDQICFNPSRIYSYGKRTPRSRLSTIRAEMVSEQEADLNEKYEKITILKKQIETLDIAVKSYPQDIKNLEQEMLDISTNYKRNIMEIKELERIEETKNVDCLQEELENLHLACKQKIEEIKECSELVSDLDAKRTRLHKEIEDQSTLLNSLHENYRRLHVKIGDVSKLKESFASGKRKYELELKCKENLCNRNQKELENFKEKLQSACSRAELACPRINTDRSCEELSRLIEQLKNQVEQESACDRKNLLKKYREKSESLEREEIGRKRIEKYLSRIGEMIKIRKTNFLKIQKNTELLIILSFTTILNGNGYKGSIDFNPQKRTLTLKASPRASDSVPKTHSSLSGGERSFVTIAFLLALWERTKMPFRILDEYDVFMDSSNRQLSVDLLCKKAEEMSRTQFIFLSPLELARMPESDCINILKIAPPKRKADMDENSPRKKRS